MADKPDVEDSESEDEEPHVTWVEKYDKPMPQVGQLGPWNLLSTKNHYFVDYFFIS